MDPLRNLGFIIVPALLSIALVACGGGDDDDGGSGGGTYVTPTRDASFYAAILSDGSTVLFFGTDSETVHSTLRGAAPAEAAPLSLTNDDGDSVEATATENGYTGTLTLADGSNHEFTVEEVSRDNGGLYRNREVIRGEDWIIGLIVLNDGGIVGAAKHETDGAVEKRTTLSLGIKWEDPTTDPERQ
jgi:hypothetical protein